MQKHNAVDDAKSTTSSDVPDEESDDCTNDEDSESVQHSVTSEKSAYQSLQEDSSVVSGSESISSQQSILRVDETNYVNAKFALDLHPAFYRTNWYHKDEKSLTAPPRSMKYWHRPTLLRSAH